MPLKALFLVINEKLQPKTLNFFDSFAQNIDCGYMLENRLSEVVLMSAHNLCIASKKKKEKENYTPLFYYT